ncbi:MAG: hypothetical protein E4G97_06725 [Deltaproteobacteria bacterium]|nr:MAG: hypothetical protein E4G97_06725 [Deltaproteobacteria bacterium]
MKTDDPEAEAAGEIRIKYGAGETEAVEAGKQITELPVEEIKARIAEKVRADGKERAAVTPYEVVLALVPGSQQDGITAILEGMAADDRYADIKAVTTASGMVFFASMKYIEAAQAIDICRIEELKFLIAEKVRADSRDDVRLSSPADLQALAPEMEQGGIAVILEEMRTEDRYADVKTVTSPTGEVYYHSDRHMSGYYAVVLSRVAAKDPVATVAAMVRDESRIYPRPTCIQFFTEPMFGIPACDLKAVFDAMLQKPEYVDIKLMVHPETGAAYAYSSEYLNGDAAFELMHWVEVVKDANP